MVRLLAARQAAARSGRLPVGRRADAPLAHPVPARGGVRGGGGDRAPARRAGATAVDAYAALEDELGDLLYQVVFHAVIAQEAGAFTMADVARGIHDKLVRRHPHVFGDVRRRRDASDVVRNWEQIKKEEKGTTSIVDGHHARAAVAPLHPQAVPQGGVGRPRSRQRSTSPRPHRHRARRACAPDDHDLEAALAQVLAAAVVVARAGGVDAESALRGWAASYRARFEAAMEHLAARARPPTSPATPLPDPPD